MTTELMSPLEVGLQVRSQPISRRAGSRADSAVQEMSRLADLTGLPFLCVDARSGEVLGKTPSDFFEFMPRAALPWLASVEGPSVREFSPQVVFYAVPLRWSEEPGLVAVGYTVGSRSQIPHDIVLMAAERGWTRERLQAWASSQPPADAAVLYRLIRLAVDRMETHAHEIALRDEIDLLSEEIDRTYEEISLLHDLTRNLNISQSPRDLAELCLDRMQELIRAEGHLIWLHWGEDRSNFLSAGQLPFTEETAERVISHFAPALPRKPVVKNHIAEDCS
ncbi:MAG TPA: hypothetical protein EYP14_07195, partial [Planctomycetaceae bacterium]|nr:hypothetical protein [Planctomycetaceae bacterium]